MIKKTSNFKDRYKLENLFIGTYGSLVYFPSVDILNQLSLTSADLNSTLSQGKQNKKEKKRIGVDFDPDFSSSVTIKVPVPPPPSDAMINRRNNQTFPLGTKIDPDTGEELRPVGSVMQERAVYNQILYTDSHQGLVYYVDSKGMVATHSLGHLTELTSNKNFCLSVLDSKIPVTGSIVTDTGLKEKWEATSLENMFYVDSKDMSHEAKARRDKIRGMSNVNTEHNEGVPLFMYAKDRGFRDFVHSELRSLEAKFKAGNADIEKDVLGEYYARLVAAVLLADKHSEFFSGLLDLENKTLTVDPNKAPVIPHVNEKTQFLPHQVYALAFLKEKAAAMVDADPGAGKTLMLLSDILDKLNRGLVTRPCIVMPNSLLSDQKAEFEDWTQGTVNFIVINTTTVKESDPNAKIGRDGLPSGDQSDKNAGLEALTALIKSSPPNTILLTSYEWLRGGGKTDASSGGRYRNPAWLTSPLKIGVDMLVLDESHVVNINSSGECSAQAEAVMQMSPLVPYKRCYTGTSAPGSPDDIFLQMSFLDPSILGSKEDFRKKYGQSEGKNKKIEMWKPGAIKQLQEDCAKTVSLSIRRSAWINELPAMKLTYHKANLSAAQRIVYERILDRIIREELGLEVDPATGTVRPVSSLPGSVGRELQQQMQNKYASNPVARDKISQWKASSVVTLSEYDSEVGEDVDLEYDLSDEEEEGSAHPSSKSFDTQDASQLAAFRAAQGRVANLWKRYEALQGETDDAPEIGEFSPLLTKFVAIDKFLNCPTSDDFGQYFLAEEVDRISPKISVLDSILDLHFADANNGKVIIFTHYKDVARHALENIKMASKAVYYDSKNRANLVRFKNDDSVQILIAVEKSIQEGQNLQIANRIIKLDMNWTPGKYEQSIARSYRLPSKKPGAARHSTVYIDLIMCEGTAELTKLARMVSKMHAVRQFISGYKSNARFRVTGMTIENMQTVNTFAAISGHIAVFKEMRDFEKEEAKTAPQIYGTDSKGLATGEEIPGSSLIETPPVDSDKERSPWKYKPGTRKRGVINPSLIFFNGGYWLTLEYLEGMKFIIKDYLESSSMMVTSSILTHGFSSARDGFLLLEQLREKGLFVINQTELHRKIKGEIPVDPVFPSSKLDYGRLVRLATTGTPVSEFPVLREGDQATKQVLAYNPSQADLKTARELLVKGGQGKEVADIHVLAAAKVLGLYKFDLSTLDLKNFYRMTNRFRIFSQNRKILEDQLSSLVESPVAPGAVAPGNTPDANGEIPGLDNGPTPTGIPVQLDVAIWGKIISGKLVMQPSLILPDVTSLLSPAKTEEVVKVLKGIGFNSKGDNLRWLWFGDTKAEAKARILKFSKNVCVHYHLGNWEDYLQTLRNLGCTEAEITKAFPKNELTAMARMADVLSSYPEYEDLTRSIYGL